jgi:hypothetical protein
MKKQILQIATLLLLALSITNLFGQEKKDRSEPTELSINEAIDMELLELKITGAADPRIFEEIVDRDGIHYGKCMAIILKSNIDTLVLLKIESGTELIPFDTAFQTMIVTKSVKFPLYPNSTYATRFYAMCGQIHYAPPYIESSYYVGDLVDSSIVKLAQHFDRYYIQNMIGQHALWAYTDEADINELEKYGADSLTIELTKNILKDVEILTKLTEKNDDEQINESNKLILINSYIVYGAGGLLIILTISTLILFIRRRKNDKDVA